MTPIPHEEPDLKMAGSKPSLQGTRSGDGMAGKKEKWEIIGKLGQSINSGFKTSKVSHEVSSSLEEQLQFWNISLQIFQWGSLRVTPQKPLNQEADFLKPWLLLLGTQTQGVSAFSWRKGTKQNVWGSPLAWPLKSTQWCNLPGGLSQQDRQGSFRPVVPMRTLPHTESSS